MFMQTYLSTKMVDARPMTLGEYNAYRGWIQPENEDPSAEGYLVEYHNGGKANHPDHEGYISWAPAAVFEAASRPVTGMSFGAAIEAARMGCRLARAGWNGKGMWIVYMSPMSLPAFNTQGTEKKVNDRTARWIGPDTPLETLGYFAMWTADKKWLPGWLASQTDMLADDWAVVL